EVATFALPIDRNPLAIREPDAAIAFKVPADARQVQVRALLLTADLSRILANTFDTYIVPSAEIAIGFHCFLLDFEDTYKSFIKADPDFVLSANQRYESQTPSHCRGLDGIPSDSKTVALAWNLTMGADKATIRLLFQKLNRDGGKIGEEEAVAN